MVKDRFALSDLENKFVNIDPELSPTTIKDTSVMKKLTGRQPIRIERKYERAYDTVLFAKLFFSANKIAETDDESDAFYRRLNIISFPNRFTDGKRADPTLIKKLTTDEELSGIFNILMPALRNVITGNKGAGGIYVKENTIEAKRAKYHVASNPVKYFLEDANDEDVIDADKELKDDVYKAYRKFCRENRLAILSKQHFGKAMKELGQPDSRGPLTQKPRQHFWDGIKLVSKYRDEAGQKTLDEES
jgi:putative DNA primase/helicase